MADNQRIDDLRRRVQKDPSSIAFAQLAEELRRAGRCDEAVEVCHAGLAIHPGYLSARVTLGRALLELNQLDDAQAELGQVLQSAPENLAAIRGVAEIFHRRGDLAQALQKYRDALGLAKNDPDLQQMVAELAKQVEPQKPKHVVEGLSFEQMQDELFKIVPPPTKPSPKEPKASSTSAAPGADAVLVTAEPVPADGGSLPASAVPAVPDEPGGGRPDPGAADPGEPMAKGIEPAAESIQPAPEAINSAGAPSMHVTEAADVAEWSAPPTAQDEQGRADTVESGMTADHARAQQTIAALERWLDAIHVARTQRDA